MKRHRISAILLHAWYHFIHSRETWADIFMIPVLQLLVFVFLALVLSQAAGVAGEVQGRTLVLGMIFWNIISVGQYAIAVSALWEIWSRSFSSLFISPLTMDEFLVGQMVGSLVKVSFAFGLAALVGFLLYGFSIFSLGFMLPVYIVELLVFAWGTGMVALSLIFRYGTDVQALSWSLVFFVQPLGGVFYPVSILPAPLRVVGETLPTSYIFDAMREQLLSGRVSGADHVPAMLLCLSYFIAGYLLVQRNYRWAKRTGAFARMEE